MFPPPEIHPIIFEEVFVTNKGDNGKQYLLKDPLAKKSIP